VAGLVGIFSRARESDWQAKAAAYEEEKPELYAKIGRLSTQLTWLKKKLASSLCKKPFDALRPVIATPAPFSVVLTDGLSATRVLGSAARPAFWCTWPRNAALTCAPLVQHLEIRAATSAMNRPFAARTLSHSASPVCHTGAGVRCRLWARAALGLPTLYHSSHLAMLFVGSSLQLIFIP